MRVCVAGTFVGRGGIQTHLRRLIVALREADHELLAVSFGRRPLDDAVSLEQEIASLGSDAYEFLPPLGRRPPIAKAMTKARGRIKQFQPDAYLACGTGRAMLALPLSLRIKHRIFHEVMSGLADGPRDSRWLVRLGFNHVVAQAQAVADNFRSSFRWRRPVPVLPAFPEPLERTARIRAAVRRSKPVGEAKAALFGRLVPHKRALWLVQQWPRLSARLGELHIFGTGPEEPLIRLLVQQSGWSTRVFCHGEYRDGQSYVDLLTQFDLTLLPTVGAEGAPLVLLEAMACGVPFVATDAGGISDYANPDCVLTDWREDGEFIAGVEAATAKLAAGDIDQHRLQQFYQRRFSSAHLSARWRDFFHSLEVGEP